MKTCAKCKLAKSKSDFGKRSSSKDGLNYYCKNCDSANCKAYYSKNKTKIKLKVLAWQASNKEKVNSYKKKNKLNNPDYDLMRTHGVNKKQYDNMFNKQNGCCAVCRINQSEFKRSLAVDHDHKTGKIRGLLCDRCNVALGMVRDSKDVLCKLIIYLEQSEE